MMGPYWQVPRPGILWLLVAFTAAVLPLLQYLPPWVAAVAVVSILWRVGIYRARWGAPGRGLRAGLALLCLGGLAFSFDKVYGLEPMVTLLVSAYGLKLLEMRGRREALMVIYLGYFVAVTPALFDQGMLTALYIAASVLLVTAGLAGIHQTDEDSKRSRPLFSALKITVQAVPLMVVLFLVMPRLGPLWSVPSAGGAITGIKDSLSPGDVTSLGRSSELAFRVAFDGDIPPRGEQYWRGMTLSRFDGREWTRLEGWGYPGRDLVDWYQERDGWFERLDLSGPYRDYTVTLEPHHANWLFALGAPQPRSPRTGVLRDFTLVTSRTVHQRVQYRARSWQNLPMEASLPELRRRLETRLPDDANPRTRELARRWAAETENPRELINRLLAFYGENFVYTLEPPALGRHSVDEFLWQTQRGFCGHFASSFVFFMRAAGVPARVVVGYQGGERHPERDYLIVREYDAHAWAEVWLEGDGWTRVDPTAAAAPGRLRMGLRDLFSGEDVFADDPLSMARFRNIPWLNRLRLQLDYLEYGWGRWVLRYQDMQGSFLENLLGGVSALKLGLFLLGAAALALLPALLSILGGRSPVPRDAADRHYQRFCRKMAAWGCERRRGEAPRTYADRCVREFPEWGRDIRAITELYEACRYRRHRLDARRLKTRIAALAKRRR